MKVAIFDMDGTLFDTNDLNYCAYNFALSKYGKNIDYDYYCKECNGKNYKIFLPKILGFEEDKIEKVHNIKKEVNSNYLNKVKVNENLFNVIELIKNKYKIVLVTTASRKNTLEILNYTNKIDVFDDIITGNDITNSKPDPEGYFIAINKYNVDPKDCIIFEDSDIGIEAGLKTGASVYKVEKF